MCNNKSTLRGNAPVPDVVTPLLWLLGINTVSNAAVQFAMTRSMPSGKSIATFAATNGVYLFFLKKMVEDFLNDKITDPDVLAIVSMTIGNTLASTGAVAIGLKGGKVDMKFVQKALIDSALTAGTAEVVIKYVLPMVQKNA